MLRHLDSFRRGTFDAADKHYKTTGQNPACVDAFASDVYRSGFVLPFDWTTWDVKQALNEVEAADLETLRKLLTSSVRQERFCGGFLTGICANGTVQKVLLRLEVIAGEGG
jgi:hypothetical protein